MTWVSASRRLGMLGLAFAFGLALSACDEKKDESAGEMMENAGEKAGDMMENAGEKAGEMMDEAGKKTGEMMDEAGKKTDEMMDEAPAEEPADGSSE